MSWHCDNSFLFFMAFHGSPASDASKTIPKNNNGRYLDWPSRIIYDAMAVGVQASWIVSMDYRLDLVGCCIQAFDAPRLGQGA